MKFLKLSIFFVTMSIFCLADCFGEYNLATKKEELLFFSTESEIKLGHSLAQKIEKEFELCKDPAVQKRIEQIGQKIAAVCERKDISYSFIVLKDEKVNAFALPGGFVYVHTGLIEKTDSDDEISAALAHEVAHIVARHSVKRLQAALGYNLISILALVATKDPRFKSGTDLAFSQIMLGYSREDELLADQLSVTYVRQSGYNPEAIITFLEKLRQIEKESPLKPIMPSYGRTHPYLSERISQIKQEIYGKMDFNDYINRTSLDE